MFRTLILFAFVVAGFSHTTLIACDTFEAPSELSCEEGFPGLTGHTVILDWTNESEYTGFEIYRGDELLEELDTAESETFTDRGLTPGVYVYYVTAINSDDDCEASTEECVVVVGYQACLLDVDTNTIPMDTETHVMTVSREMVIADVKTRFSMTTSFALDWTIDQVSPAGTVVTLHDIKGSDDAFDLTWTDSGGINAGPYDCGCDMKPQGPGLMADYAGEFADGEWGLDLTDVNNDGTINEWCLIIDPLPLNLFIRGDADGNGDYFPILEAVFILEHGFVGGDAPPCMDAADADDDGEYFPIVEALYILVNGFSDGPDPEAPFPDCGGDETEDGDEELGCDEGPADCL